MLFLNTILIVSVKHTNVNKALIFMKNLLSISLFSLSLIMSMPAFSATLTGAINIQKKNSDKMLKNRSNGLVYLTGVTHKTPSEPALSVQKNKQFEPRVLPIVKGQEVRFFNEDIVQHNVFSNDEGKVFDLGSFSRGQYRSERFEKSTKHTVYCNIHQSMIQDIIVLENSYFSKTSEDGTFNIENVPAGNYTLHAWHIHGGEYEKPITVKADMQIPIITLSSTKVVRDILKHKNKLGRRYKRVAY